MKSPSMLLAACLALAAPAFGEIVNRIVASVDGDPITLYELDQYQKKQAALLPNLPAASEKDMLQALITEKLLAKEIASRGIQVRDQDIDRYIGHIRDVNHLTEDQLKEALKQQGMEYDKYRQQVRSEIEKVQLLNREIRGKVNVTPEEVQRYYDAHKKDYEKAGGVKLRQITLKLDPNSPDEIAKVVIDRIQSIRAKALKGEDFATLAKQNSEDPTAHDGGDLGEVDPAKLVTEFEGPLNKMKEGEVSEPIRTKIGVVLLKLEKRIPAGYQPETEVAADIKEKLYNEALDDRYKRWLLEDIQKHHYIEIKL